MRVVCRALLLLSFAILSSTLPVGLGRAEAATTGELVLDPQLMHELNSVLKLSSELHRALVTQNEEQTEISLRDLLQELEHAISVSAGAKPHDRSHLVRILDAAHEQFELTQSSFGEERRARLEDGFNQVVNLIRIYRLDRAYAIFFCPKDRTTWVQRGSKGQNPFHPDGGLETCSIKVPR